MVRGADVENKIIILRVYINSVLENMYADVLCLYLTEHKRIFIADTTLYT
jgi:hypothetical protein